MQLFTSLQGAHSPLGPIRRRASLLSALFLVFLCCSSAVHGSTQTYTLTVKTDRSSYSAAQPISITGAVSPPPGPNTAVIVTVKNPNGTSVDVEDDAVNATTGSFIQVTYPGGTSSWVAGTYVVNATWGRGNVESASSVTTFTYSKTATSSSGSSSTSSSQTTSTSTSTSTTSSSSTTTSSLSSSTATMTSSTASTTPPPSSSSSVATSQVQSTSGTTMQALTFDTPTVLILVGSVLVAGLGLAILGWRRRVAKGNDRRET